MGPHLTDEEEIFFAQAVLGVIRASDSTGADLRFRSPEWMHPPARGAQESAAGLRGTSPGMGNLVTRMGPRDLNASCRRKGWRSTPSDAVVGARPGLAYPAAVSPSPGPS